MKVSSQHLKAGFICASLLTTFTLVSCDGGADLDGDRIAPESFSDVTLQITSFTGPAISFVAGRGQADDGVEEGVIEAYTKGSTDGFLFPGTNFVFGGVIIAEISNHPVKWPDEYENGQYRYTPVGESSARLEMWGTGISDEVTEVTLGEFFTIATNFLNTSTSADPVVFDLTFNNEGGSSIASIDMIMTTPRESGFDELIGLDEAELALTGTASITSTGGSVPIGYDTDYDGESEIFDGELDGHTLTLIDDLDATKSIYVFVEVGFAGFGDDIVEIGNFTMTYDNLSDPTDQNTINPGSYELSQVEGTDQFLLDVDFDDDEIDGSVGTGEILSGVITLDFVNSTYTRPIGNGDGTSGTVTGVFTISEIGVDE